MLGKKIIIPVVLIALACSLWADPPVKLQYQGKITQDDTALNGLFDMTFRLYSGSCGGTLLWTEIHSGASQVQVTNGLFNVLLGDITAFPEVSTTFNQPLWLEITVGTTVMTPCEAFNPVPYAMYAIASPGSGAVNYWSPNGTHIYNNNTGNVGIGTTAPATPLDVYRSDASNSFIQARSDVGRMRLHIGPTANYIQSSEAGSATGRDIQFSNVGGTSTWMTIKGATGNVGIGNASPTYKLDVTGSARVGTSNAEPHLVFVRNGYNYVQAPGASGTVAFLTGGRSAGDATSTLVLKEDGNAYFNIGNVGIGTTTPSTKLDVDGTVRIRGGSPVAGRVLTASDANGNATWEPAGGDYIQNLGGIGTPGQTARWRINWNNTVSAATDTLTYIMCNPASWNSDAVIYGNLIDVGTVTDGHGQAYYGKVNGSYSSLTGTSTFSGASFSAWDASGNTRGSQGSVNISTLRTSYVDFNATAYGVAGSATGTALSPSAVAGANRMVIAGVQAELNGSINNPATMPDTFRVAALWAVDNKTGGTATSYAGYFDGKVRTTGTLQVGNYTLPATDGTALYVLKTDGVGNVSWQPDGGSGAPGGSGTDNYISKWTGGGVSLANSQIYDSGTNVGIGTTSPQAQLHVYSATTGEAILSGAANADGNLMGQLTGRSNTYSYNAASVRFYADGAWSGGNYPTRISFWTTPASATQAERMRIDRNGNVGIGTTSPASKLSVNSAGNAAYALYSNGTSTVNGGTAVFGSQTGVSGANTYYGVRGQSPLASAAGAYCYGVRGDSYRAAYAANSRAYGVMGYAGNATAGYNYALYGYLMGTGNGAAVYGTTSGDVAIPGIYAGYFNGAVRTTGTLQVGNYTLPNTDGTSGYVLKTNGSGTLTWQADNTGAGGDNLGNHTATQNLNMNYFDIRNIDDLDGAESGEIGYIYMNWNCADGGEVGIYNSDLYVENGYGITLGGVYRTTWPSAGTNYWTDNTSYINPNTAGTMDFRIYDTGQTYGVYKYQNNTTLGGTWYGDYIYRSGTNTSTGYGLYVRSEVYSGGGTGGTFYGIYSAANWGATTYGVYGRGENGTGYGVYGYGTTYGVYGQGGTWAGYFNGNVRTTGYSEVYQNIYVRGALGDAADQLRIHNNDNDIYLDYHGGHVYWRDEGGSTRFFIQDANGYIGVNTTAPSRQLHVYGAAGNYPARVSSPDGYLDFGPANTGWCHFETDRASYYFNPKVTVNGNVEPYTNNTFTLGTDARRWATTYTNQLCLSGDCRSAWPAGGGSVWTDNGNYLYPNGGISTNLQVADVQSHTYGFYSNMNTGTAEGYGGYFKNTTSSSSSYGIYASANFTGTGNPGYNYAGYFTSTSASRDNRGIAVYAYQNGSGSAGYSNYASQFYAYSYSNSENYGVYSYAYRYSPGVADVYGGYFNGSSALTGATNYGIYATASGGTTNWAGYFGSGNVYIANNVGIGTTSPSDKLHVSGGNLRVSNHVDTGNMIYLADDNNSSGENAHHAIHVQTQGNVRSYLSTNGDAYFSGNVGIGTTSPGYKLEVNGTFQADNVRSGTFDLPTADGSSGQFLQYDGTWATPSGGSGGPVATGKISYSSNATLYSDSDITIQWCYYDGTNYSYQPRFMPAATAWWDVSYNIQDGSGGTARDGDDIYASSGTWYYFSVSGTYNSVLNLDGSSYGADGTYWLAKESSNSYDTYELKIVRHGSYLTYVINAY